MAEVTEGDAPQRPQSRPASSAQFAVLTSEYDSRDDGAVEGGEEALPPVSRENPARRLSKAGKSKSNTYRYRSAAGTRKLRLERERLIAMAAENQRLLTNLNRIYNSRRRSTDNGPHVAVVTDAGRFPHAPFAGPAVVPHIEVGRSTQLSRDTPTTTAARHVAIVAAARHAIAASESKYLGTLSLPLR